MFTLCSHENSLQNFKFTGKDMDSGTSDDNCAASVESLDTNSYRVDRSAREMLEIHFGSTACFE
jgi:hypothetical protein